MTVEIERKVKNKEEIRLENNCKRTNQSRAIKQGRVEKREKIRMADLKQFTAAVLKDLLERNGHQAPSGKKEDC